MNGVVDDVRGTVPDIFVDVTDPGHNGGDDAGEALASELSAADPFAMLVDGLLHGGQVLFHLRPPVGNHGVVDHGVPVASVVGVNPALDHVDVHGLGLGRSVVPPPEKLAGASVGIVGGLFAELVHVPFLGKLIHGKGGHTEGLVLDVPVDHLELLVVVQGRETKLGGLVLEQEVEVAVGRLNTPVGKLVQQAAKWVLNVALERRNGNSLKGGGELQVQSLDVEDEVGLSQERGHDALLREPPSNPAAVGLGFLDSLLDSICVRDLGVLGEVSLGVSDSSVGDAGGAQPSVLSISVVEDEGRLPAHGRVPGQGIVWLHVGEIELKLLIGGIVCEVHGEDSLGHKQSKRVHGVAVLSGPLVHQMVSKVSVAGVLQLVVVKPGEAIPGGLHEKVVVEGEPGFQAVRQARRVGVFEAAGEHADGKVVALVVLPTR
mmetsp:Transcript_11456/g.20845  ORF Transcript_11456/g.20845 Transcript_11456/m.20845 type:complete len:432 (+) Transcript_11456:393-1688(+)